MDDDIEKKFATSFKAYLDTQPYGALSKLAKELKVQQSAISNWSYGRRKSTETQRRRIAKHIGIS